MPRTYKPWLEKHKAPRGFGSRCPVLPNGRSQRMLDAAVPEPGDDRPAAPLYYSDGEWCFVAHAHAPDEYHGYPVAGREVPPSALRELLRVGAVTSAQFKKLLKQASVPSMES